MRDWTGKWVLAGPNWGEEQRRNKTLYVKDKNGIWVLAGALKAGYQGEYRYYPKGFSSKDSKAYNHDNYN